MDGVLYRGSQVLPGAPETLARLRGAGWSVFFATNSSSASREEHLARLCRLGLPCDPEHLMTGGFAAALHVARRTPRVQDALVVGTDGLRDEFRAEGVPAHGPTAARDPAAWPSTVPRSDSAATREYLTALDFGPPPDVVVVGLDLGFTYATLAEAQWAVLAGAELIATNKDSAFPVEGRVLPGCGPIVAAIESATGRSALCIGKPEPFLFEEVIRRAGPGGGPVIVIGDSVDYDIVAAHRAGATGVLVLTGLTDEGALRRASGEAVPDRVVRSLDELFALPEFAGA